MTALRCLELELEKRSIPSGSQQLDQALSNGFRLGCITEITGGSGSGKTQLCLQLTINTLLPTSFPGLIDGDVVFISTKRNFCPQRLIPLIDKCVGIWQNKYKPNNGLKAGKMFNIFTRESALKRIQHRLVLTLIDLISSVYQVQKMVNSNKNIHLIVIDSLSSLLRDLDPLERIRIVYEILNILDDIASNFDCAVVLTTDLTTNISSFCKESSLKPALGEPFHHRIHQRIVLAKDHRETIVANVQKNISQGPSQVKFRITKDGIKDL